MRKRPITPIPQDGSHLEEGWYVNYQDTSTSNYAVRDSSGYTSSGTITTSTPVRESAEFTDNNNTIFMNMYDSRGSLVGQESHFYSVRSGGDDYETFGHNVGFLIGAINARGRMLKNLLKAVDSNDDIGDTITS